MNTKHNVSLMLLLCGSMVGCDGLDESDNLDASLEPIDANAMLEIGVWPPAQTADPLNEAFVGEVAPPPFIGDAVPVAGNLPPKNVEPTEKLMIGWLRWVFSIPWNDGPITDQTGEHCADSQQGPVWYLAGTTGGPAFRECDIPAGKQLFVPLVNRWCVYPSEFYANTDEIEAAQLGNVAWYDNSLAATCSLTLRIDGQDVMPDFETMHEELYVRVAEGFEVDLDDAHWAAQWFDGGIMPATGDGHYALLQPLTPGDHIVEFGGGVCGQYPFSTSATYLLHVGE